MATASVSIIPECSICYESLKTPKFIPCGHTFCLECLEIYIGDKIKTFLCPICQQKVKIPKGGAKMFTTNFILQTSKHTTQVRDQPPSTTQPKCPNHNQREVDYYCNNCNVGLCLKCIFKQHRDHETLDIECDETRNEAIDKLQRSQKIIKNRIKKLEETRSTLLESFEQLKSLCEDSCARVTEKTEQIVSDLRKSCEQIIKNTRNNLEENRIKVVGREKEITSEINLLENDMESNISPSTKTTLNILLTLPRLIEIEKLAERSNDYNLCLQYLQWLGKDFSLNIDQLGSVISKPLYIPGSYQFVFNVSDIEKDMVDYYNRNKFRYNNLVWSCSVSSLISCDCLLIKLELPDDNCRLNYYIDGQISLLNIDDESKTITTKISDVKLWRFERNSGWCSSGVLWTKFIDKNNGYFTSEGKFVVQFDITHVKEKC